MYNWGLCFLCENSVLAAVNLLTLQTLTPDLLPAALDLDRICLGGLWTEAGYEREIASPNSDLFILQPQIVQPQALNREPQPAQPRNPQPLKPSPIVALGCLWAILEEAHITVLAVHPDYQRQGLGQALLWALLASAQQRGLEWATLEVRESNDGARSLYEKFGFQTVGKRRKYYPETGEDALILWRRGLQDPDFIFTLENWRQQVGDRLQRQGWQLIPAADLTAQTPPI